MAVDVSKIPNSKNFDTVREAIIALDDSISDTGNSISNATITIQEAENSGITVSGGVFTLNQSGNQTVEIDASFSETDPIVGAVNGIVVSDGNATFSAASQGTGVTISNGEISIGQAVATTSDVTFNTVTGDLTGDVYASNGTSKILESGTDGTGATFAGNADTASAWETTRAISIGGTSKNVDGSGNVTWTQNEIGLNKTTIDDLQINADELDGQDGSYYLNYANFYGNYTTDYDNSGVKIARGVIYYVGSETDIANVSTPTATFNFVNNTLTFTANGSDYSEAPPDSASTQNKVFLREWNSYNAYVGTETARGVSFTNAFESTQYNGPVTFAALKTAAATIINGDNITTGAINSTGFTAGTEPNDFSVSGTKLFLTGNNSNVAGDIISPQFKITSGDAEFKGSLASTSGSIGGWDIEADAIVSPDDRVELNKDSGLQIKNSSGTPKVQIRSGALTGLTSKTFTFSGLSTLEFNTFNDTLTSNSEDFLYNGTTSLSAAANITSTNYGVYVEQISMNATPVGQTVFTTSSDFIGNVNVEVRMDIATDSSFSNILKTVVLQTAGTSSAGVDVDFVADARNIEININQNVTTAYMRVYYYRNVFVGAGSVDFDTGSSLTSFDFGQTNGVFAKTINQTELTDEGFQVIYDSNNYLKTSTVSASSEFVEIEGGLNLDGIALNVQNYASRTAAHSDTVTANFYQRLSDTCIMQWGYVNGTLSNPTTTFPLTFPKACRSVHVSTRRTSSSGNGTNYVYSVTASSFRAVIEDSNGQGRDFFWIAFGD